MYVYTCICHFTEIFINLLYRNQQYCKSTITSIGKKKLLKRTHIRSKWKDKGLIFYMCWWKMSFSYFMVLISYSLPYNCLCRMLGPGIAKLEGRAGT